jgi:hypothetical protein
MWVQLSFARPGRAVMAVIGSGQCNCRFGMVPSQPGKRSAGPSALSRLLVDAQSVDAAASMLR